MRIRLALAAVAVTAVAGLAWAQTAPESNEALIIAPSSQAANRYLTPELLDTYAILPPAPVKGTTRYASDRKVFKATGRAEYALTPGAAVFVQAAADRRDYRLDRPAQPASRDSHGVEVMGGANFELGRKVRGEVGVGYIAQDYRDPAFRRLTGFSGRADLQWYATPLTTVSLTAGRTLEDSGVIGAPGYISTNVEGRVDHELLRNLILTGKIGAGGERFQGLDRKDRRKLAELAATYQLNRGLGLTLSYTHMDRSSSGLARGDDFDINRVALGLTLRR